MKSLPRLLACLLACALPAAAVTRCVAGNATGTLQLDNYTLSIDAGTGEHASECHTSISGPAGKIFEQFSYDLTMDEFSGKDVNNDGQPDLILVGHLTKGAPTTYWIISIAEPAGLARQITTVYPLAFEDRDGDGKLEIWTREWSYEGIDGLSHDDSPHPLVALRLVGNRLAYVSNLFPSEYEAEILQARQHITKDGVERLKNEQSNTGVNTAKEGEQPKQDPKLDARAQEAKVGILGVVTSYLYSGKGAEAWKALGDWPYNDRMRIQQAILRARQNGLMRQLTAPQPVAPNQAGQQ